jgi:hypothetical protein
MATSSSDEMKEQLNELKKIVSEQAAFITGLQVGQSTGDSSSTATAAKEKEEGPWAPHYRATNPHTSRPRTVSEQPQLYDLAHSKTFDLLESKVSALKYEFRTLEPMLSYLYDVQQLVYEMSPALHDLLKDKRSKPADGDDNPSEEDQKVDESTWSLVALSNSLDKVYQVLSQRGDYIRLKVKFDNQPGGMSIAERALLQHLEIQFYGMVDGLTLVDDKVSGWIKDFGDKAATATLNHAAKQAAQGPNRYTGKGRGKGDRKGGGGKGGKGKGKGGPSTHAIED